MKMINKKEEETTKPVVAVAVVKNHQTGNGVLISNMNKSKNKNKNTEKKNIKQTEDKDEDEMETISLDEEKETGTFGLTEEEKKKWVDVYEEILDDEWALF